MDATERLHSKVIQYAQAEIHSILLGDGEAQRHFDQLIGMLNGYIHCGIISQAEADALKGDAEMALSNALRR
jgi:hypothetical protein